MTAIAEYLNPPTIPTLRSSYQAAESDLSGHDSIADTNEVSTIVILNLFQDPSLRRMQLFQNVK